MLKSEILKKTEKIASAVYLITGFFDDKEPLKWKLRTLGSDLPSAAIFIKDNELFANDRAVLDVQNIILEIDSLFFVAKQSGLVSEMNHEILSRELSKFADSISDSGSSNVLEKPKQSLLSNDFFGSSIPYTPQVSETKSSNLIKDKIEKRSEPDKGHNLDEVDLARIGSRRESKPFKDYSVVAVKKNTRQSTIINLLKRKREIMIKDVSPLINGCSEKTIQRELMAMVHNGTLRKIGEKRWSRYSLA
jgi:hypothetical protein